MTCSPERASSVASPAPMPLPAPVMSTLCIAGGRKDKVRPGDILGALTGEAGIPGAQVGKIAIFARSDHDRGSAAAWVLDDEHCEIGERNGDDREQGQVRHA